MVLYSYERIKDNNLYWLRHIKNILKDGFKIMEIIIITTTTIPTGFSNPYTDDMFWIGLTLLRMSEVLDDNKFADTAKRGCMTIYYENGQMIKGTDFP